VSIVATQDLLISGTTLLAKSATLKAEQAIKATAQENAPPVSITGELHLGAATGIGGFGFERVLIEALTPLATVSAFNRTSGDVVIAGLNGLTVSTEGIQSNSDGWVALLGGSGTITEQGQVVSKGNVVRVTGVNWMERPMLSDKELANWVSDVVRNGALSFTPTSPLEQMNQRLAKSWTATLPSQGAEALSSQAQVLVSDSRAVLGQSVSHATAVHSASVMASPQTTSQLLEMAMIATQQGQHPAVNDKESLNSWIVRSSPSERSSEATQKPRTLTRETPVQTDVPNVLPAAETPLSPIETAPTPPAENPVIEPTSDVRWLLPQSDLSQWSDVAPVEATKPALLSSLSADLTGAVAKFGQWLGLGAGRSSQVPDDAGSSNSGESKGSEGNDKG
jgi:hypothetical protein